MKHFREYIKEVRARGYYAFTTQDALSDLGITRNALNCGMYKLKKKGDIVSPAKNLYVIVPPEHQHMGCIPADELIPILMDHWHLPYYVCLLSAAQYHGAAHQKPQVFQVMTNKQIKSLSCGKVKIDFIYKQSLNESLTNKISIKTGYLNVSTPELTAWDLLHYSHHVGGLNHIATVLSELIERINPEALISLAIQTLGKSWVQRLGYILEHIDSMDEDKKNDIVERLHQFLGKPSNPIPLAPELPIKGEPRDHRWMIIENTTVESDL